MEISVEHDPSEKDLEEIGALSWPTWEKEVSSFPWTYGEAETCYVLEGKAKVTDKENGLVTEIGAGDLVVFPKGLICEWEVIEPIRKHYKFG